MYQMLLPILLPILLSLKQAAIAAATPIVIGAAKKYLPGMMEKVPGYLMPVVAGVVGVASGSLTGLTDVAGGVVAGLAGTGIHQVKVQAGKDEP
jgi:hypothetical protein